MSTAKNERKIAAIDTELRQLLSAALRRCLQRSGKKREQVAEEMSVHAGVTISKPMLDHWTTIAHADTRFPAFLIASFCEATGDDALQRWAMGIKLRGVAELREEQVAWLADSLRAELVGPKQRRRAKKSRR